MSRSLREIRRAILLWLPLLAFGLVLTVSVVLTSQPSFVGVTFSYTPPPTPFSQSAAPSPPENPLAEAVLTFVDAAILFAAVAGYALWRRAVRRLTPKSGGGARSADLGVVETTEARRYYQVSVVAFWTVVALFVLGLLTFSASALSPTSDPGSRLSGFRFGLAVLATVTVVSWIVLLYSSVLSIRSVLEGAQGRPDPHATFTAHVILFGSLFYFGSILSPFVAGPPDSTTWAIVGGLTPETAEWLLPACLFVFVGFLDLYLRTEFVLSTRSLGPSRPSVRSSTVLPPRSRMESAEV